MRTIGATLLGLMATLPAAAQEFTFQLHHFLPALSGTQTDTLEPWARRVEENADGRVSIEIFPSMSLGGRPAELVGQARDGVVDLIWTVNGYTPGVFPRTEVFELPGIYVNDPARTNLAMRMLFENNLSTEYSGLKVLFLHVHAGNGIHTVDTPVHAPAELAGLALRTPSRTGAWVIEALGANPVAMPVPDLPQALSRGTVGGALIPWEVAGDLQLQDQTDFQIEGSEKARFGTTVFQLSMNLARWDSLPPEIQQAFVDASGPDWLSELGAIWRANDDAAIERFVAEGNTHITLTPEETAAFDAALAPVVDRWIEDVANSGIDGVALVARAREAIAGAQP